MHILLVENRYTLHGFYHIFSKFPKSDVIGILVFNPSFVKQNFPFKNYNILPKMNRSFSLKFKREIQQKREPRLEKLFQAVTETDRFLNYFNGNNNHYYETYQNIKTAILDFKPDIIIGERTTYYELFCSKIAQEHGIKYVSPQASRYPIQKTVFVRNNSNLPYILSSNSRFPEKTKFKDQLINSSIEPSYMAKRTYRKKIIFKSKSLISGLWSRTIGEVYCTPSIFRKLILDTRVRYVLHHWRNNSSVPHNPYVIFALQLQPEANLDVDATAFRNQVKSVIKINKICKRNGLELFVKCNPKAKYELLDFDITKLINLGIKFLPLETRIFNQKMRASAIITSTGTALIEAFLHGISPISLGGGELFKYLDISTIDDFSNLERLLNSSFNPSERSKDLLLDKLQSFCINLDYPDPSISLSYYKLNSDKIAAEWREICKRIHHEFE